MIFEVHNVARFLGKAREALGALRVYMSRQFVVYHNTMGTRFMTVPDIPRTT